MTDALDTAIVRFRADPEMARFDTTDEGVGGCWATAHRFAVLLDELDVPYEFKRWRNLPGRSTPLHHNLEVDGQIVCWTHRQIDPDAEWPHVEPVESYQARFGEPLSICTTCGSTEESHTCEGLVRDPWAAALAKLSREQRRRIERLIARVPPEQLRELMVAPHFESERGA